MWHQSIKITCPKFGLDFTLLTLYMHGKQPRDLSLYRVEGRLSYHKDPIVFGVFGSASVNRANF